jgi:flagellar motility protein MotE (MotC chaperone)
VEFVKILKLWLHYSGEADLHSQLQCIKMMRKQLDQAQKDIQVKDERINALENEIFALREKVTNIAMRKV